MKITVMIIIPINTKNINTQIMMIRSIIKKLSLEKQKHIIQAF